MSRELKLMMSVNVSKAALLEEDVFLLLVSVAQKSKDVFLLTSR